MTMLTIKSRHPLHYLASYLQIVVLNGGTALFVEELQTLDSHVLAELHFDLLSVSLSHLNVVVFEVEYPLHVYVVYQILYVLFVARLLRSLFYVVSHYELLLQVALQQLLGC